MRHIQNRPEPASWTADRKTPNATYKATADLRLALTKDRLAVSNQSEDISFELRRILSVVC